MRNVKDNRKNPFLSWALRELHKFRVNPLVGILICTVKFTKCWYKMDPINVLVSYVLRLSVIGKVKRVKKIHVYEW